jgi:RNA-binding protein
MTLTEKQKKYLRGLAHPRNPVVLIGQHGLTSGVSQEVDTALNAHELIKIKARVGDRAARDAIFAELVEKLGGELVQRIGNVGVFYRPRKDQPKIVLPD